MNPHLHSNGQVGLGQATSCGLHQASWLSPIMVIPKKMVKYAFAFNIVNLTQLHVETPTHYHSLRRY